MEKQMSIEDRLKEIQDRIARAIAGDRMDEARAIYNNEFLDAEEAKNNLWECR